MMMEGGQFFGMGFGWIIPLALIGLVIWAVIHVTGRQRDSEPSQTPLEVLKVRYAKGELSREEFERMRQDLS